MIARASVAVTAALVLVCTNLLPGIAVAAGGSGSDIVYADPDKHFHPKGKQPSEHTLKVLAAARKTLPFADTRDFEEQRRGLMAVPDFWTIEADAGHTAWDMERYKFFLRDEDFPSIHPSLQRQSRLNMNFGLYKVMEGVYQVRGFDLANITFIEGDTGWIIFDPLTSEEPARAALKFVNEQLGERPVRAVVYSHSHGDHFGGVRGVVDEADVNAGRAEIIAPRDFMNHAISENVYAGNAMNRRLFYQYGILLPASPFGHAGQGLMQNVSLGNITLIPPTRVIEDDVEELIVDGVYMEFQNTPNTEAPSNMNTWFPDKKLLWTAENVTGVFHNIYTLRGAQVRDALRWSKYINRVLYMYGQEAEVMFASHHWPRWGNERIQEVLRGQRDLYANINNQVLHYANQGVTINQIHNVFKTPEGIAQQWYNRGYHGSPEHNSRGVINRFLGYWDANPATLIPLSPAESAPLYVKMMGGSRKIIREASKLHKRGEYLQASEILNKLMLAEPDNQKARDLLADVWEQIGYQQENPGLRNSFLAGAYELRSGIPGGAQLNSTGPDVVRAMSTELFLDFLGIRMDVNKVEDFEFTMNLVTPDNGEQFILELSNQTLTNVEGFQAENADLTLTINRTDLNLVIGGVTDLPSLIAGGEASAEGDVTILARLGAAMVDFDPRFEILPGTAGPSAAGDLQDFESGEITVRGE